MVLSGYELLANAVVKQAAKDYRKALCIYHEEPSKENLERVNELERFFTGKDIMIYTSLDGNQLMRDIQQQVVNYDYNYRAIEKSLHEEDE